ncbi:UNVERIFIED_CONTAM: Retrovirus-related Pol polyprotein from transposon TNT 1-94 [Sesamum calycinum]|uniref:Retrovirus-related Pol polyprotein from transposon TNT 1-94 n=1 Tax=Sesamum calycinum TaxID=2727403 RepID=A0AAW2KWZ6_9LAMI
MPVVEITYAMICRCYNDLHVLQRSRKLSKDEVVLRLGDGKVVAAEGQISQDRRKRMVDSKSLEIHNLDNLPALFFERGFPAIPDAMSCSLRNKVRHLSRMQAHRLHLLFPLIMLQLSIVIWGYDFIKNDFDPFVYKKVSGSSIAFRVLYVGDILLIGNDVKMFRESSYMKDLVKTILKYLRRTKDMFLVYGGGELILEGYSDASFQSDDDDAKSQSRFVFKLNSGVVDWKSFKQDTTADSTTEVEYIVASEAVKEGVWMKNYFQQLGVVPNIAKPIVIFYDNNGAISQAKQSRSHHRFKYIFRRYHLLREMVRRDDVRMDEST